MPKSDAGLSRSIQTIEGVTKIAGVERARMMSSDVHLGASRVVLLVLGHILPVEPWVGLSSRKALTRITPLAPVEGCLYFFQKASRSDFL